MENVSDPVTVHFEVAITQLANVVSARLSPLVPLEVLTAMSEKFPTVLYSGHTVNKGIVHLPVNVSPRVWALQSCPHRGDTFFSNAILVYLRW